VPVPVEPCVGVSDSPVGAGASGAGSVVASDVVPV
jgi:hypothetical protein